MRKARFGWTLALGMGLLLGSSQIGAQEDAEWISLFNGEDFTGWRVPGEDGGPWAVVDGVIDCDPARDPDERGDLWTEEEFGDFVIYLEWRFTDWPTEVDRPLLNPDGSEKRDEDGNVMTERVPDPDSGLFLRGQSKAQINMWNWPVGSGEIWGYRTDGNMPEQVRAGATPDVRADNPLGEWNTFVVTMIGDRVSVVLNGALVVNNVQLPGVAERGPIGLQHHGRYRPGQGYSGSPSLVQMRNIRILPLD